MILGEKVVSSENIQSISPIHFSTPGSPGKVWRSLAHETIFLDDAEVIRSPALSTVPFKLRNPG